MFKRLKRIESLMEQFAANEAECLKIVRTREFEYQLEKALAKANDEKPWKCPRPGCIDQYPHVHVYIESAPPAGPDAPAVGTGAIIGGIGVITRR